MKKVASTCEILAHLNGKHGESSSEKLVVEFSLDQVDLTQVGLGRVPPASDVGSARRNERRPRPPVP